MKRAQKNFEHDPTKKNFWSSETLRDAKAKNHEQSSWFNNNNNNNGFRVRFGVRRRHRGHSFALGYHQFIIFVAIQGEGEEESGYTNRVGYFRVSVRVKKTAMVEKGAFLTRKETRARLGRIEVGGGGNSKWMGRQTTRATLAHNPL